MITTVAFLYNLFTTYGNLQQLVGIQLGDFSFVVSRGNYFFFFLGFYGVLNLGLIVMASIIHQIPKSLYFVPNAEFWTSSKENRKAADKLLVNWLWAIAVTANYFLMYWMLVVENSYHFEGNVVSAIAWFHLPGLVMAASLVTPLLRLMIKNINLVARQERD